MRELTASNHLSARLREKEGANANKILAGLVVLLVSVLISVLTHPGALVAGVAIFFILFASAFAPGTEEKILKEGISGEETFKEKLKGLLSDEYIGLFSLPLPKGGDIDCFLVGPTGAYLFDVKNHNGHILFCDGKWTQLKVGRRGTVYEGKIKTPDRQVRRAIAELKKVLKAEGVNLWIEGIVVFVNPKSKVFSIGSGSIRVLDIEEIDSLFKDKPVRLASEDIEAIANLVFEKFSGNSGNNGSEVIPYRQSKTKGGEINEEDDQGSKGVHLS